MAFVWGCSPPQLLLPSRTWAANLLSLHYHTISVAAAKVNKNQLGQAQRVAFLLLLYVWCGSVYRCAGGAAQVPAVYLQWRYETSGSRELWEKAESGSGNRFLLDFKVQELEALSVRSTPQAAHNYTVQSQRQCHEFNTIKRYCLCNVIAF